MPIPIRSWTGLLAAASAVGLEVYEPVNRCDFFVYIRPTAGFDQATLRDRFHLHVFLESNIATVADGAVVSVRIRTILPKTTTAPGAVRPDLVGVAAGTWRDTVAGMNPSSVATTEAARLFDAAVATMRSADVGGAHLPM
jgi:hypothetical protein